MSVEITLYFLDLEQLKQQRHYPQVASMLYERLAKAQQDKLETLKDTKQTEFLWSRSLLNFALDHHQTNPSNSTLWKIEERPQLPPLVEAADSMNLKFSISHSQALVGIAICRSEQNIGLDIQVFKDFNRISKGLESAKYFCHQDELDTLTTLTKNNDLKNFSSTYTQFWSLKEAYFKAQNCSIHNQHLKRTLFDKCDIGESNTCISQFQRQTNELYQVAIFHPQISHISCQQLELNESHLVVADQTTQMHWQGFQHRQE